MQIRKSIVSSFKKAIRYDSCADPGNNFRQVGGEGGVSRSICHIKKALTTFFFYIYFVSPQFILQKSSGYFQRKLLFTKVPVGVEHFPGGGRGSNFLQGGPIPFSL